MDTSTLTSPEATSQGSSNAFPSDIARYASLIVNAYFVGEPGAPAGWTLVDTAMPFSASGIIREAERRFGRGVRPNAIVLTHGHFDHVGSLIELAEYWDVPIWAHRLEAPYLTGRSAYPPPDPTVGGGMMARLSPLYPKEPIDVSRRLHLLPDDGTVPPMPGWHSIHTPGHTHGHVSLFRPRDRALIVGDAFVTAKQESLIGSVTKFHVIHGPPMYFTSDWQSSYASVVRLEALQPRFAYTGHGLPISGRRLSGDLATLVSLFHVLALPAHGRYVDQPATADEGGVTSLPPPVADPFPKIVAGVAVAGLVALLVSRRRDA